MKDLEFPPDVIAIVPAAGSSSRVKDLGNKRSKIFLPLPDRKSVLEHTLRCLYEAGVRKCVIPTSKELTNQVNYLAELVGKWDLLEVIVGGESRFDSVFEALLIIEKKNLALPDTLIAVHDAARPFCPVSIIKEAIKEAASGRDCEQGVVLGVPAVNTIKRCTSNKQVIETLDRDQLYEIQTPQIFPYTNLRDAYSKASDLQNKNKIFDDASVYELAGFPVKLVDGARDNIKVTFGDEKSLFSK